MPEKKNQKIVALLKMQASDKSVILNGIKIASLFRKELCLVYNHKGREKKRRNELKDKLLQYTIPVKKELGNIRVSTLLLSENKSSLSRKLSDDFEAIFVIADTSHFTNISKSISVSPIPFLFVHSEKEAVSAYKKVTLPMDFRSESSESAIWASYFGRFNKSEIAVVAANEKRKEVEQQVTKNVVLSKKLFQKFEIKHRIFKGTKSSIRNAYEALELANSSQSDLIIILGSSTITPLDKLIGLPERKIIKKADQLPVLIVNPRRDNYVLCD